MLSDAFYGSLKADYTSYDADTVTAMEKKMYHVQQSGDDDGDEMQRKKKRGDGDTPQSSAPTPPMVPTVASQKSRPYTQAALFYPVTGIRDDYAVHRANYNSFR